MLTMHWMHVKGILMSPFHFWCQITSVSLTQLHRMRFSSKSLAWPRANARLLLCEWPCSFMLPWVWLVSCWAGLKNWWCGNSLLAGARTAYAHVLGPYDDYDQMPFCLTSLSINLLSLWTCSLSIYRAIWNPFNFSKIPLNCSAKFFGYFFWF